MNDYSTSTTSPPPPGEKKEKLKSDEDNLQISVVHMHYITLSVIDG